MARFEEYWTDQSQSSTLVLPYWAFFNQALVNATFDRCAIPSKFVSLFYIGAVKPHTNQPPSLSFLFQSRKYTDLLLMPFILSPSFFLLQLNPLISQYTQP